MGMCEVRSGLITYLDFPQNIAAGFRMMTLSDLYSDIPPPVMASMQHVLGRIEI